MALPVRCYIVGVSGETNSLPYCKTQLPGGADFVSGDAKPLHSGTNKYICKYTIPEGTTGEFKTMVGKLSADTSGNTMESFYTHSVQLTISNGDATPEIVKGGGDSNLTQPNGTLVDPETIMDIVDTGDIIAPVEPAPDEESPRDEAFIFRKCIEQLISDLKSNHSD